MVAPPTAGCFGTSRQALEVLREAGLMGSRLIVRDVLRLLRVWAVVFGVVTAALFLTTDGEPVCEGPLIIDIDDSSPPQCNTHVEGFEQHFWVLVTGTLLIASVARVVIVLIGGANPRTNITDRP